MTKPHVEHRRSLIRAGDDVGGYYCTNCSAIVKRIVSLSGGYWLCGPCIEIALQKYDEPADETVRSR